MDICGSTARLWCYKPRSWGFLDGVRQVDVLCVASSFSLENLWQIATILAPHMCNFKHHGLPDMQKLHVDLGFYVLSRN